MKRLLALALLLAPAPAAAVSVEVAKGDWSKLPKLEQLRYDRLGPRAIMRLYQISGEGQCRLPGRSGKQLDLSISFAAQFSPDGSLQRVILPQLDCPEAEGIIGGAVLEMLKAGDYRIKVKNDDGWYRGNFGFGYTG